MANLLPFVPSDGSILLQTLVECLRTQTPSAATVSSIIANDFLAAKIPLGETSRLTLARAFISMCLTHVSQTTSQTTSDSKDNFIFNPADAETAAATAIRLLRTKKPLPRSSPIDWRPFADALSHIACLPSRSAHPLSAAAARLAPTLLALADAARAHFDADSAAEIIKTFLPSAALSRLPSLVSRIAIIATLLPIEGPPPSTISNALLDPQEELLDPQDSNQEKKSFFWIKPLFSIWIAATNIPAYDFIFVSLFARLAEAQFLRPHSDIPIKWLDLHIRLVFSVALRALDLPVGTNISGISRSAIRRSDPASQAASASAALGIIPTSLSSSYPPSSIQSASIDHSSLTDNMRKNRVDHFASFFIYTITPICNCEKHSESCHHTRSIDHLESFIQATESFFHPSNNGKWSHPLARLLHCLAQAFYNRIRAEDAQNSRILACQKLPQSIRSRFVSALRPVVFIAMFGKDSSAVAEILAALKYLAWIDPSSILPPLLDRVYPALESLTETHRTLSCIAALHATSYPLISCSHYPLGGQHLPAILHLTLPGIDMNDITKSTATLLFIRAVSVAVPFFDNSSSPPASDPSSPTYEADEARRLSTAEFESWLVKYIDRVIHTFESLPQNYGLESGFRQSSEASLINMLINASSIVFQQLSPALERIVVNKLADICRTTVIPNATKAIGALCSTIGVTDPHAMLSVFVPMCIDRIRDELDHGAASRPSTRLSSSANPFGFASMSDATLHWFQSILFEVLATSGDAILPFIPQLESILDLCLDRCVSRRGYKLSGRLLRSIIHALSMTYPKEMRSHNPEIWNDPDFQRTSYLHWGEPISPENVNISWHVPSQKGIDVCERLLTKYLGLAKNKLEPLLSLTSTTWSSNELCRWLSLLKNVLYGIGSLLGTESSMSHNNETENLKKYAYRYRRVPLNHNAWYSPPSPSDTATAPDVSQHPFYYWTQQEEDAMRLVLKITNHLRTHRPDDVESLHTVISTIQAHLTFRSVNHLSYDNYMAFYRYTKSRTKLVDHQTTYPRYVHVYRSHLVHLSRAKQASTNRSVTPLIRDLVYQLAMCSVSPYTEIRKKSQASLSRSMRCFSVLRYDLVYLFLGYLTGQSASTTISIDGTNASSNSLVDSDCIKGALYMLRSRLFMTLYTQHWQYLHDFVTSLVQTYRNDKSTVQDLVVRTYVMLMNHVGDVVGKPFDDGLGWHMFGRLFDVKELDTIQEIGNTPTNMNVDKNCNGIDSTDLLKQGVENYRSFMNTLMDVATNPRTHWRFASMSISIMSFILSVRDEIPDRLTASCLDGVVHEMPVLRLQWCGLLKRILIVMKERSILNKSTVIIKNKMAWCDVFVQLKTDDADWPLDVPIRHLGLNEHGDVVDSDSNHVDEETMFVDDLSVGWFIAPDQVKTYMLPKPEAFKKDATGYIDLASIASHNILVKTFSTDRQFWHRFIRYASQEASLHSSGSGSMNGSSSGASASHAGGGGAVAVGSTETFSTNMADLYKRVFAFTLDAALPIVQPIVDQLLTSDAAELLDHDVGNGNSVSYQRAAAEIVAGIVRGSKHWDRDRQNKLWIWVMPILTRVLFSTSASTKTGGAGSGDSSIEVFSVWMDAVRYICIDRDPKRVLPLLNVVFRMMMGPLSSSSTESATKNDLNTLSSFFAEAKRLYVVATVVSIFATRLPASIVSVILRGLVNGHARLSNVPPNDDSVGDVCSSYDQVRRSAAMLINELLQMEWRPRATSLNAFVDACTLYWNSNGNDGVPIAAPFVPVLTNTNIDLSCRGATAGGDALHELVSRMRQWRDASESDQLVSTSVKILYRNAAKSLLAWFTDAITTYRVYGLYPHIPVVLPMLIEMLDNTSASGQVHSKASSDEVDSDHELQQYAAVVVCGIYSHVQHHHPRLIEDVFLVLLHALSVAKESAKGSTTKRWHIKTRVLPIIQVMYFRHLYLLSSQLVENVMQTITALMGDPQVEVRQLAAVTLSGMIRCSMREGDGGIHALVEKFCEMVRRNPLPNRRSSQRQNAESPSSASSADPATAELLVRRHAGILGLSAIVLAFPYTVPASFMPQILVFLASCASDPSPISTTITKTFADFKRTHQDTWHEDRLVFTEEELSVLTDVLISPGYYA